MALFRNNPSGGIMDVIRCDETGYLIWKWHPAGSTEGATAKENAIRWGSSLRVKTGEAAVFVYHSDGEVVQDPIIGPYDSILKTENLPIITTAIGLAYNGNTPFQAEIYFINLAQILQVTIGVTWFDVADPRFQDRGVPTAVRGVMNFKIADALDFINKYQLRTVSLEEFKKTIKAATVKYVKDAVMNAPDEYGIPVTQLEKRILDINEIIEKYLKKRLSDEFGVTVTSVDISDIEIDKTSPNYKFLIKKSDVDVNLGVASKIRGFVTDTANQTVGVATSAAAQVAELATNAAVAAADVKEYKYAKHKRAQIGFVKGIFKGDGDLSAADSKPSFSSNISKGVSDISKGVSGFVSAIGAKVSKGGKDETPPPIPTFSYHVAVDGNSVGPLNFNELMELVNQGKLTLDSLVWKRGMKDWTKAKEIEELAVFFEAEDDVVPSHPSNPE